MSKKVILYVGGFELPDKNAAAQRVISNGKIFRDLGYKVVFLGFDREIKEKPTLRKTKYFGFDSWAIPYPATRKEWLKYITSFNEVDKLIKQEYKDQVFSVICYNYPAVSQYRIKKLSKRYGIYSIADVTEWYGVSGNNIIHKSIKLLDTVLRMRVVNRMMNALITTSPYLSEFYEKKHMDYVELPTLYDSDLLIKRKQHEVQKINKPPVLMYAGSPFDVEQAAADRSKVKERLDVLINIMFNLSIEDIDFELNVFGVTEVDYLKVYPEDISKLEELRKKVFFKGRESHNVILENIEYSDFTVFFRDVNRVTEAGFPSKFAESITCGTPVITNLMSNIAPYGIDGENCFLLDITNKTIPTEEMKKIISLSSKRILELKRHCLGSRVFDYHAFKSNVESFFEKLS